VFFSEKEGGNSARFESASVLNVVCRWDFVRLVCSFVDKEGFSEPDGSAGDSGCMWNVICR
jgi:hypothetical protein